MSFFSFALPFSRDPDNRTLQQRFVLVVDLSCDELQIETDDIEAHAIVALEVGRGEPVTIGGARDPPLSATIGRVFARLARTCGAVRTVISHKNAPCGINSNTSVCYVGTSTPNRETFRGQPRGRTEPR